MKSDLFIFDIDGVIANITHRLPYAKAKNYDKFYADEEIAKDIEIGAGVDLLAQITRSGGNIVYATGRPYKTRKATVDWFASKHLDEEPIIWFRADGDYRPSSEVKVELVGDILDSAEFNVENLRHIYFVDDDLKNVEAIEQAFPEITGIVFTTKRLREE